MTKNDLFTKVKKRLIGTAYHSIDEDLFFLGVAEAFALVLKARKNTDRLITAYTDQKLYRFTEALSDFGFICEDIQKTFFGGDPKDVLRPYNDIQDIERFNFDVILGKDHLDILFFCAKIKQALKHIKHSNFKTCLNFRKLMIIAAQVCLIPNNSSILEVGAYQCGTTIFIAQLCRELNKNVHVVACDTFEGMPIATDQDKQDPIFYDSGMFTDNPLNAVTQRINKQRLGKYITLVKGDVVNTLPKLSDQLFSLVFLDTDQYKGTKAGLDLIASQAAPCPSVIIDDTSLLSVNQAISEFLNENACYARKNLTMNLDYLSPIE